MDGEALSTRRCVPFGLGYGITELLSGFEPEGYGLLDFFQGLMPGIAVSEAAGKLGRLGDVGIVCGAPVDDNLVLMHHHHALYHSPKSIRVPA